ncbi:MAG: leucine-rich repeat domain-containing protein, partial [Candidatus Lokiarchaeota archaeon]
KFILIPNCSIVGWRLPGYKKTGFTNTEAKNYGEVIEDMIKYYDSVGATKEEVLSKNLVCIDGSGGGALAQIAWSFKTSKDVLEGKMDKKYLKKEEFEEEFHQELRKIWDGKYSKELALINKYCLLYPSWEDDPELMELEREEKRNEAKEINIDYLLDLSSRKELREEVLKQFLKEDSRIIKFLIKEKLISHLEQADIEKIIEKFNFSILREIGQGNVYLLFNSLMKIANTKSRKALEKEVEVHYINKNQGLQELSLMSYKLEFIPKSIGNLSSLRRLDLSGNELKTLPKSICRLKKLEKLILFWNNLKKLPESIGNLSLLNMLISTPLKLICSFF